MKMFHEDVEQLQDNCVLAQQRKHFIGNDVTEEMKLMWHIPRMNVEFSRKVIKYFAKGNSADEEEWIVGERSRFVDEVGEETGLTLEEAGSI